MRNNKLALVGDLLRLK